MNVIINNCRQITGNLLRNADNLSRRYYATTIADYKITWTRPEEVSRLSPERSGDQGLKINVNSMDLIQEYAESPEMKDANDLVRRIFTLQFQPRKKVTKIKINKYRELVKRHEFDRLSPEALIANYTCQIHDLQEFTKVYPRNTKARVSLKEAIEIRRKWLKHLRTWDYKRFEWVLETLNLVYKPDPHPPHQITRKESLTRLTEKYCDKLVQDKLNAYKKELKEAQVRFYIEKAEKLAFIRKEELACGLQPSVSEEDIAIAKEKAKKHQT